MLKIFLAEDEFVVREGIKNNIDWKSHGFNFCGEAADGELAFPLIQSLQPDIIITDIKMPFMNGLELSRLILEELPQSKIIILSGHEEFSYAQEAIKIGVTEYLLKPIKGSELLEVVKRIGKQIVNEREEMRNYERYKREMEENETDAKRKLFNNMVSNSLSIAKILEYGKEYGLELSAKCYQVILFKYEVPSNEGTFSSEIIELEKQIYSIYSHYDNIIVFDRAIEGVALLLKGDSYKQIKTIRANFIAEIKKFMAGYTNVSYFGGIGNHVDRLTLLSKSYETAARAFSYRFIFDKNDIISSEDILAQRRNTKVTKLGQLKLNAMDTKKAVDFLRSGEAEEIAFFIDEFLLNVNDASEKSFLLKQYILMNIYFTVVTFLKDIGADDVVIEEPFTSLEKINEMYYETNKAKEYIERIFTVAIKRRDALRTNRNRSIIDRALEYIKENYSDENICLNDVAAYVYISPSHFSSVFSKETGKSFIRYLTDLRMQKARELLKCTDRRCADISIAVGYKDPHYFSYLFKKLHSCTPMQYRSSENNSKLQE